MKQTFPNGHQSGQPAYERIIDISETKSIVFLCGKEGKLTLRSGHAPRSDLVMIRQLSSWILHFPEGSRILCNECPARDGEIIQNGNFLQVREFPFYFRDQRLWSENRDDLLIKDLAYENLPERGSYPVFCRNTRIQSGVDTEPVMILDPSELPRRREGRMILRFLPSLGMLAAAGFMASRGGTAMLLFSGISAVTAITAAAFDLLDGSRQYRRRVRERCSVYSRYIAEKRQEIETARKRESSSRHRNYPPPGDLLTLLNRFSPDLFDRSPEDGDFLHLRLGAGTIPAEKKIRCKIREQLEEMDELQQLPEQLVRQYQWLHGVPVICDMKETVVLGVTGREADRYALFRNMVLDIVLHQCAGDVRIICAAQPEHARRLHWLRLIPHLSDGAGTARSLAADRDSMEHVLEDLYRELSDRKDKGSYSHHILAFFYDEQGFREHPVSRFLSWGKELGISFVFFADRRADLIQGCRKVLKIQSPGNAVMVDALDDREQTFFTYEPVGDEEAGKAAELLAPVYTREVSLDHTLTSAYSLYQMLGIRNAEELDLAMIWKSADPGRSLAAPIGICGTGTLSLDIHDTAHGPHGLVAGTTGSGKSELLQTYILSMAAAYPPDKVGFVIIDYKGGGLAHPFRTLPHLLGTVTNMDHKEALRSLRSVKGELLKRQKLFEQAQVNHIDRYMKRYQAGEVPTPLPHLVIIIDEFAELKAAHPEFMQELVSAARIGRSLGVHLILATQKPSGQVSDQIWSNSKFRICLKVQDASDSNEVLKSPLAAEIREPGRGYLQVGNNELFELFQSAYSSAPAAFSDRGAKGFSISRVADTGERTLVYEKAGRKKEDGLSQMQALVRHICSFCQEHGIRKLPDIFSPALESMIPYSFRAELPDPGFAADIGWYDDPDQQRRCLCTVDLKGQHVLVTGSSRSGKTNLLETLIRDLSMRYRPEELRIYIIDCASRVLKHLEELPQVGGVVLPTEREKLENLFRMLRKDHEKRKSALEHAGVPAPGTSGDLQAADPPRILLVIDHLSVLKEVFLQDNDVLMTLCNEGLSTGIHVAASEPLASAVGYRYLALFGERIALYSGDTGEYRYLYDHLDEIPEEIPGRCIVERDGRLYSCQSFLAFPDDKAAFVRDMKKRYRTRAKPVPVFPERLTRQWMEPYLAEETWQRFRIPAGMNRETFAPAVLDLAAPGTLYLSGRDGGGRHNWIAWMVRFLEEHYHGGYALYIADGMEGRLGWMKGRRDVAQYSRTSEGAAQMLVSIDSRLRKRWEQAYRQEAAPDAWDLLVWILDSEDALESVSADPEAMECWSRITGTYRRLHVCTVIACVENAPVSFGAPELLRELRERRCCLFFDDLKNCRLFELPYAVGRDTGGESAAGDAWYLRGSDRIRIRTPLAD